MESVEGPSGSSLLSIRNFVLPQNNRGGSERDGGREWGTGHGNPHLGKVTVEVLLLENFPELYF